MNEFKSIKSSKKFTLIKKKAFHLQFPKTEAENGALTWPPGPER